MDDNLSDRRLGCLLATAVAKDPAPTHNQTNVEDSAANVTKHFPTEVTTIPPTPTRVAGTPTIEV